MLEWMALALAALGTTAQDRGDVAVLVDDGRMVTERNPFDLGGTTLRFEPAGDHRYSVSRRPAALDSDFGPALAFGFAEARRFPGDDDSEEIAFPAGFPFFGKHWESVWVNADGNLTFREPDFGSTDRDKACFVHGPPRIAALFHDWAPFDALNPTGNGSVHAVVRTNPDRLVATWSGVADYEGGVSSTLQVAIEASGAIEITIASVDTPAIHGIVGIAEGDGAGPITNVDLGAVDARPIRGGAILEAFATETSISEPAIARAFYATHEDLYDFLVILTDFPSAEPSCHGRNVSNSTHGIGDDFNASDEGVEHEATFDRAAEYGSAGELEQIVRLDEVAALGADPAGSMDAMARKVMERYGASIRCARTPESAESVLLDAERVGFDLSDGAGRTAVEDRGIIDLGMPSSWEGAPTDLAPGERLFAATALHGYSRLDQYRMGLRRAEEVGPFFLVERPKSVVTGRPLESSELHTRRARGERVVFKGTRVDLTMDDVRAFARTREPGIHGEGRRFWGPEGNAILRYSRISRRADPFGGESVVLSERYRELGDEADWIDADGKPVDVKTMAFVLVVKSGAPADHSIAIGRVDAFRREWQTFANGPATGGRGRFETRLDPVE